MLKTKCKICDSVAVKDQLCYNHYIEQCEKVFCNNADIDNLGIIKWAEYFLPHHTSNKFPPKHRLVYAMLLNLYSPTYKNKYERLRALRAFREYSKTGMIRILVLYLLMHSGKKIIIPELEFILDRNQIIDIKVKGSQEVVINDRFYVIVSETGSQAEEFTTAIRDEISSNSLIHYFYGKDIVEEVEQEGLVKISDRKSKMQWTRRAFKVNKVSVLGIGAKQRIRGRIKGASRPDFLFFDDIYSEENVKTKESRDSVRRWFNDAAMKTLDMVKGKAYVVGTILSDDTIIVDIKRNPQWLSMEVPLMSLNKLDELIKNHIKTDIINSYCELPYGTDNQKNREYFLALQKQQDWTLEWEERIGLYEVALMYKEAVYNRGVSGFYQEYFHIIIPEEDKRFKPEYFKRLNEYNILTQAGFTFIEYKLNGENIRKNVNLYIGIDLGTGTISGDDTALVLTALDSDSNYYILDIKSGKYSYFDNNNADGIYDIILRYCKSYRIRYINIGYAGSEKGHIEGLRQYLKNNGVSQLIIGRKQLSVEGSKAERITNNILHLYQAGKVYHTNCMNIDKLEYQLEYLGKADSDDIADALEVSMYNTIKPSEITLSDYNNQRVTFHNPFHKDTSDLDTWKNSWRFN